ncbi:two-component system, NarL family, sensor histidine kinase BarA [Alteromonadaceae bacterium Bs31]|nr:two-component system, NarL family, sensor histidine kinase BarA [Alteromonadaceae bacterium Bs31]
MLRNQAIKRKVFTLVLVPCAVALFLLGSIFLILQYQSVSTLKWQRDVFIHSLFSEYSGRQEINADFLDELSLALLSTDNFRTMALLGDDKKLLWYRGLPLPQFSDRSYEKILSSAANNKSYCQKGKCYLLINTEMSFKTGNISNKAKSVVIATDNMHWVLGVYQYALTAIFAFTICFTIAFIFARKFQDTLLLPLEKIAAGIQRYISGRYEKQIPESTEAVYNELVTGINQLAKLQKISQNDLQHNIEQSTAELRETLETVEIQNIELDLARKTALQASRVKSEFLANTSHEIRTPLNGIIGFSELLKKTELNSQQAEYLETIDESAKGLLTIINDILDFSRLEIGKLTLEYKPVRLRQVIEDSLRLQAPSAHEKKLRLLTVIDHDIPEHLLGDPLRLKQVLSNLLSNAIKFTNTGHILVSISKEDGADNQITLQFRITDSGIGLNQDQQEKLFDAFTQLDSSESRAHGGTGLGLAIAKGLVDRMNGQIGVESEPGKGATFWFTSTLGRNPNAAYSSGGYLTGTLRNIRAVVYDCSTMSRAEITHYIRGWGAEVSEISRFEDIEAKTEEACRTGQVHLAILDAQINQKTFDKTKLRRVIDVLNQDYSIPVIVLASPLIQRLIEPALVGSHSTCILRPLFCNRLHQTVCEQLGIIIPESDSDTGSSSSKRKVPEREISILAVDDNPANLRLVCELLKDLEVNVVAVNNGAEALSLCAKQKFDLILMDIQMPGMDGLEATKELRKRENPDHRTPVVALTAHAVNEQKAKLLLAGMDDYLTKPVSETELKHIIDRWVSRNPHRNTHTESNTLPSSEAELIDDNFDESEKLINIALALTLSKNKPDLARDMLNMLLESLPQAKKDMATYLSEGNHRELQEVVHKLHGGCCYCGVPKLKKYSEELDVKLQSALQAEEVPPLLEQMIAHLNSVIDEMLLWRDSVDINALFQDEETSE